MELENILESLYFSASRPISTSEVLKILDDPAYDLKSVKEAITNLEKKYHDSSFELVKVASGHRFRIKQKYSPWISKLWSESDFVKGSAQAAFFATDGISLYMLNISPSSIPKDSITYW